MSRLLLRPYGNQDSSASSELRNIAAAHPNVHVIKLELTEESASVFHPHPRLILRPPQRRLKILNGNGLYIFINNIGIGQEGILRPDQTPSSVVREQSKVNVTGPQIVTMPLVREGKKIIVNM